MSESQLVNEILREVGRHCYVVRCNSGSVKLPSGKRFAAMPAGFSDIMAILPGGRAAFIEVKAPGGKTAPEQEKFLERMKSLGARAGVARSVGDALEICCISATES